MPEMLLDTRQSVRTEYLSVDVQHNPTREIDVTILTGGFDKPYAYGLCMALLKRNLLLDVIGSDEVDSAELRRDKRLRFLNLLRNRREGASALKRGARVVLFYLRLLRYAWTAKPRVFHVLWNNRLQFFDRTLLLLYYAFLGKKVVFTAHNVNASKRDGNDSLVNRLTLRVQYRLVDHIFVHTEKMKCELLDDFGVDAKKVSVIPFGINNSVPDTAMDSTEAKKRLGIRASEKVILFFGAIREYKGLEYLVEAFQRLSCKDESYRLIIAGEEKKGSEDYLRRIQQTIHQGHKQMQILQKIEFVPDEDTEIYFKAADVAVLPYTMVFQSGVLFLAYSFGLPVIVTDVGSFEEDVLEGRTGFVCRARDAADLGSVIEKYFESDLFRHLNERRREIRQFASSRHSWDVVGELTRKVYEQLINA